jgi:hypothetical protein
MDEGAGAADADASLLAFLGPPGAADADAEVSVGKTSEHSGRTCTPSTAMCLHAVLKLLQRSTAVAHLH